MSLVKKKGGGEAFAEKGRAWANSGKRISKLEDEGKSERKDRWEALGRWEALLGPSHLLPLSSGGPALACPPGQNTVSLG